MATSRMPLHFAAHRFSGLEDGPKLIVLGAVHGNEVCGSLAIRRILPALESGEIVIRRGCVSFVPIANPLAWQRRTREGERNLNRRLQATSTPTEFEDHVANWLCPLLEQHDALLDLHSFHTPGTPFVMLGPEDNDGALEPFSRAAEERALTRALGIGRFVDGWLDTYARGVARRSRGDGGDDLRYGVGTTEFMRSRGGYGLTVECGQHDDSTAIDLAEHCIRATLAHLGLTDDPPPSPREDIEHMRMIEVFDKCHENDRFVREWNSFDPVCAGQTVGLRADGSPVRADRDGYLLFPNPDARAGQEWFYLAEAVTAGR
jgi:predicted deacylase